MLKGKFLAFLIFFMIASLSLFATDIGLGPSINFVPANPHVGDTVSIQTGILSVGGISKNVRIITKMGNTVIYNHLYPEFAANNAVSINVNWVATLGTHTVKFLIDSVDASTPDTNTANNEVSKTFTILAQVTSPGRSPGTVSQPGSPGQLTRNISGREPGTPALLRPSKRAYRSGRKRFSCFAVFVNTMENNRENPQ